MSSQDIGLLLFERIKPMIAIGYELQVTNNGFNAVHPLFVFELSSCARHFRAESSKFEEAARILLKQIEESDKELQGA